MAKETVSWNCREGSGLLGLSLNNSGYGWHGADRSRDLPGAGRSGHGANRLAGRVSVGGGPTTDHDAAAVVRAGDDVVAAAGLIAGSKVGERSGQRGGSLNDISVGVGNLFFLSNEVGSGGFQLDFVVVRNGRGRENQAFGAGFESTLGGGSILNFSELTIGIDVAVLSLHFASCQSRKYKDSVRECLPRFSELKG